VEINLGIRITDHDLGWKAEKARQWLAKGNQIKFRIEPGTANFEFFAEFHRCIFRADRHTPRKQQEEQIARLLDKAVEQVKEVSKVLQRKEDAKTPFPYVLVAPLSEKDKKERDKQAASKSFQEGAAPAAAASNSAAATAAPSALSS